MSDSGIPPRTPDRPIEMADNARVVLESRYLAKDARGEIVEAPEQLFRRVANNLAEAERLYGADDNRVREVADQFYDLMTRFDFLPNSPTLGNAGRPLQQLSACFVLPVPDSIDGIFDSLKSQAMIHKSGGGTGFAFSRLRPEGSMVGSTAGVASGPVSFMKIFDAATEQIKQGGTRRGANMAILSVDHPDIEKFIHVKADMVTLTNFNISVGVTERFMQAVERDEEYELIDPHTKEVTGTRRAREIFRLMVENAWKNGDPGMVFLDRMNNTRSNPVPSFGPVESTNPCGEQPLYPYDSCNLGSINLSRFVKPGAAAGAMDVDWDRLAQVLPLCVRFLDNVIDMNKYPIPEIEHVSKRIRRIGLGVMGWADLLYQLRIPYDSDRAIELAEQMMAFIEEHADQASEALAKERGVFPAWEHSIYGPKGQHLPNAQGVREFRNSTRTTIAPTGTLSIIADCSGGIEPVFSLAFIRQHYLDRKDPTKPTQLTEVNKHFRRIAEQEGFYSDELMDYLAHGGSLHERDDVPEWVKQVFVTAHDITPEWHVKVQAAFQRHTDNAVSKTINFPNAATVHDVEEAYMQAYRLGCKGITIYRDGSRDLQVLSHGKREVTPDEAETEIEVRAETGEVLQPVGRPYRRRLADERRSITHKFTVGEQEGYLTVGLYEDDSPGEIFVKISKEGSTVSGLMDAVALLTSISLQYGVPLEDIIRKMKNTRFEPSGWTPNPDIPQTTSLLDYIFRWLELKFIDGPGEAARLAGQPVQLKLPDAGEPVPLAAQKYASAVPSGMGCPECGAVLHYAEGCLICRGCGYTKCG